MINQQVTHGIDLETLEGFANYASAHPEAVQFCLGAAATYAGTAAHCLAKVDSDERGGEPIARETLVSLARDVELTINTSAAVTGDD